MKKVIVLSAVVALGACTYGNPPNYERYYGNADISRVDWTRVDAKGKACQTNWLGFIPTGSQSVARAVERGNLARVVYIDTETIVMWPIFVRDCTNVYGQGALVGLQYGTAPITEQEGRQRSSKTE